MTTFLGRHSEADDHIAQLVWLGHDVRVVSGGDDKAGVLDAFATGLELPDWFGHNWDALARRPPRPRRAPRGADRARLGPRRVPARA